jgi:hypothetical protein
VGEKNDGVDPTGKAADYQNWSWKEIKVAICGAVDTSHTNELSERQYVSEPQTFYDAATHFDTVKTNLQGAKDDTERYTKALIGTEEEGWKGPTANAFRDMMNKFKGAYEGHLAPLVGPPSYRTTLEGAATKLQKAINDISDIDSEVAGKVMQRWKDKAGPLAPLLKPPWHTEADGTTIVAVSTDSQMVDELTNRMRPVITQLHNDYAVLSNDLHPPADVNYPGAGPSNGPNGGPPPPNHLPPPAFNHAGPPPPVDTHGAPPPDGADHHTPPDLKHAAPPPPADSNVLLGPDGKPLLGPHGELLGLDGKPLLGAHGELLNQAGAPLLNPGGQLQHINPATKLADAGGFTLPPVGDLASRVPGALPGGLPGGGAPGAGFGGLPAFGPGSLGPIGRGGGVGSFGRGGPGSRLTSGEPRERSGLLGDEAFSEHGPNGLLGGDTARREALARQRAGAKSQFPGGPDNADGANGALGRNGMPGQGGQGAPGDQEEERERETWLLEDRDVWGAAGDAAAALGKPTEE